MGLQPRKKLSSFSPDNRSGSILRPRKERGHNSSRSNTLNESKKLKIPRPRPNVVDQSILKQPFTNAAPNGYLKPTDLDNNNISMNHQYNTPTRPQENLKPNDVVQQLIAQQIMAQQLNNNKRRSVEEMNDD